MNDVIFLLCLLLGIMIFVPVLVVFVMVNFIPSFKDFAIERYRSGLTAEVNDRIQYISSIMPARFKFQGIYSIKSVYFLIWEHEEVSQIILTYVTPKLFYDIETEFDDGVSICTSTSKNAMFFPTKQGHFKESFPNLKFNELMMKHAESIEKYCSKFNVCVKKQYKNDTKPAIEKIYNSFVDELLFLKTIPFYYIKAIYWFYYKKYKLLNISCNYDGLKSEKTGEISK